MTQFSRFPETLNMEYSFLIFIAYLFNAEVYHFTLRLFELKMRFNEEQNILEDVIL